MRPELSLADQVCLAIIGEGRTHGWAIVKQLAPDGELGRIWSLSRALTYRSIDRLAEGGYIDRHHAGRRSELAITRHGRAQRRRWLDRPVDHLRELRTEFLLKVHLGARAGLDSSTLIERQHAHVAATIAGLTAHDPVDAVDLWRQESARAAQRFLERVGNYRA